MSREFGLFYELAVSKRDTPGETHYTFSADAEKVPTERAFAPDASYQAYMDVADQIVLADELGFHNVWFTEHHFWEEFSQSSAPEVFFAYLAARTERIRLGHGVKLLPFNYNHPIRAAEQAAVLDLVSNGRLDFGTGRSITRIEMAAFGIDPAATRDQWSESLDMIVGAWTDEMFEWDSPSFTIPPRPVLPKPRQLPHPPIWGATTSGPGHELIGQKGLGLLSLTIMLPLEELANRIALYKQGIQHVDPIGKTVNDKAAGFTLVYCAEDNARAREEAEAGVMTYLTTALTNFAAFARWIDPDEQTYRYLQLMPAPDQLNFDYLQDNNMIIVGDPDHCATTAEKYFDAGLDQLMCCMQLPGIPHHNVMESIRLWGKHVMPTLT